MNAARPLLALIRSLPRFPTDRFVGLSSRPLRTLADLIAEPRFAEGGAARVVRVRDTYDRGAEKILKVASSPKNSVHVLREWVNSRVLEDVPTDKIAGLDECFRIDGVLIGCRVYIGGEFIGHQITHPVDAVRVTL